MWRDVFGVWYQVTFDNVERVITTCPDDLWTTSMWDVAKDPAKPHAVTPDGADHPLGDGVLSAVWKSVWHGLAACEFNMFGRPPGFRTTFTPSDPTWIAANANGFAHPGGEVVPVEPPSRDELLGYLQHNRAIVDFSLDNAREVGDGQSELGPWRGPTSLLLSMFHGNACHFVSHATEVDVFLIANR